MQHHKIFGVERVIRHVFIALLVLMGFHLFLLTFWNFVFRQPHLWKTLHVLEAVPVEIVRFEHCIHWYNCITSCVYLNPVSLCKLIIRLRLKCRCCLDVAGYLLHSRNTSSLRSWREWAFCGGAVNSPVGEVREGIVASGKAASEIPACLISYPFWMPPTFIAFDDEIKLTNHRKGDVIQTNRFLFAARAGISRNHHKAYITRN